MADAWRDLLKKSQKTCLVQDGKRKIHFTLPDGTELVEEYELSNHKMLVRKWKKAGRLGGAGQWEYEVGENPLPVAMDPSGVTESANNPILTRTDAEDSFQWRIRNLPYPIDVYNVVIDNQHIVVKTSNKKYYKRIRMEDMERFKLPPSQDNLTFAHAYNTLIITYKKPIAILEYERDMKKEFMKMKAMKDGDVNQCNTS